MHKKFLMLLLFVFWALPAFAKVETIWVRRYNGPENLADWALAMVIDKSGNVYVTGATGCDSISPDDCHDYTTIKYYSSGDTAWVRTYNGPGDSTDVAYAIAVDDSGNVYVTGSSWGEDTYHDYATIKYYPNGDTAWVRRYDATNATDVAYDIAIDDSGYVYVTGRSDGIETDYDYSP